MKPATFLLLQLKGETQATAINPTLADLTQSPYSLLSRQGICDLGYARGVSNRSPRHPLLSERGLSVDHVTVWRWVQRYAPELNRRLRPGLKPTNDSWRVDETYIRVKGKWVYWGEAALGS